MRILLLIIGWGSLIGSIGESIILLHALWLMVAGAADWGMTAEFHIKHHLSFFYFLVEIAYALFPDDMVRWFLNLPVLIFYPVRIVASIIIGSWALRVAKRMKRG